MAFCRHVALLLVVILALPSALPAMGAEQGTTAFEQALKRVDPAEVIAGQWVAGVESSSQKAEVNRTILQAGAKIVEVSEQGTRIRFETSQETSSQVVNEVAQCASTTYVEPLIRVQADFTPSDPYYSQQWGLPKIGAPAAWDISRGSAGVVIAVVDTGVSLSHTDLSTHIDTVNDYDFANQDSVADDDQGHGTHVAGIAAASANGSHGVGVAPNCTILPVKVLDADGSGSSFDVADGIEWAADHGAGVINLSLGSASYSSVIAEAVVYAQGQDVVVVAASGNDGWSGVMYPAAYPGVLGVGATDSSDSRASFSNYGPEVDLSAPGVGIVSTSYTGGMTTMSGTSMATPFVAGAAGLVRAIAPSYSWAQVSARLTATASDKGAAGRDDYFGYGRLNVAAAVSGLTDTPTDDNIPGIAAPASPIVGSLAEGDDDDVYRLYVAAGSSLSVGMTGPADADFDLYLYDPTAQDVRTDTHLAASSSAGSSEQVDWTASKSGYYYVRATRYSGSGSYSLTYTTVAGSYDGNIPGVPVPSTPVSGFLDGSDLDDVYRVHLASSNTLSVTLDVPVEGDFDLYLFGPTATDIYADEYLAASAGTDSSEYMEWTASTAGDYYVVVHCYSGSGDYTLSYSESGAGQPNLVGGSMDAPSEAEAGSRITVTDTVANQGTAGSGGFRVSYYLSPDQSITFADRFLGSREVSALAAGASSTADVELTLPQGMTGTYYVGAIADANGRVAETNESDNTMVSASISVVAPPMQTPYLTLSASSTTPSYRGALTLDGYLTTGVERWGTGIGGKLVEVQASSNGASGWMPTGT